MNELESNILEYLDKLEIRITDPTQKQQNYFEEKKHRIVFHDHKHCDSDPTSPFSLRDIHSPLSRFHIHAIALSDTHTSQHHHHHKHQHIFTLQNAMKLNSVSDSGRKMEI